MDLANRKYQIIRLGLVVCVLGLVAYAFSLPAEKYYDDWRQTYFVAAQTVLKGKLPYDLDIGYYNPPWVALGLVPFAVFGFSFGAGLLAIASVVVTLALCRRYQFSLLKTTLTVISPILFAVVFGGQIDILLIAGVLLPVSWWPVLALSKPQVALALGLPALKKEHIMSASLVFVGVFVGSLLIYGWWPPEMLAAIQANDVSNEYWNIFSGMWPYYLPLGVWLAFRGLDTGDERYLLAASPFFLPYAAYYSFLGVWLLLLSKLNDKESVGFFILAWATLIAR